MEIHEEQHGAVTVLRPTGPLTHEDAVGFSARVAEASNKSLGRLVIDAAGIPFADSSGLEALLAAAEEFRKAGGALRLAGAGETLREILEVTELTEHFDQYADAGAATRSFL